MDYSKRKAIEMHELLFELKCVAIKPRSSKILPRSRRQLLASKKVLFFHNTDIPWKKRKFHQLMQRASTATSGSAPKKLKEQNPVQLKEEQASLPVSKYGLRSCVDSADSLNRSSQNGSLRSRRHNISRIWTPQTITQGDMRDWNGDNGNVVQEFVDDSTTGTDELDTQTLLDGSVRLLVSGDSLRTDVVRFTFQDEVMENWKPYCSISPILDSHDLDGSSEVINPPDAMTLDGPVALLVSGDNPRTKSVRPTFQDEPVQNCDDSISPMLATNDPDCSSEVSDPPPGIMTLDGSVTLLVSSDGLHTEVVRPTFQDESMQSWEPYDSFSPILIPNDSDSGSEISSPIVCRRKDEVMNWIGQQSFDNDLDVLKGLGTKVVPNEGGDMETNSELIGSERSTLFSCDPPDYMECINNEFEFRSSELEKSLLSTLVDCSESCYDLQAKVAIDSTLEEDEPMRSSEPDKTIESVLDFNDSDESGSCYDIQTDARITPIVEDDEPTLTNRNINSDEIISSTLTSDDLMDGAKSSNVLRRSGRLSNFTGDSVVRTTIPISDRFQADLPKWIGPNNPHYNLESSKWLGTKIWPNESGNMNTDMGLIGQGRSDLSCSCDCPDSTECIKHHIDEKRRQLLSEIGDAFYSWGFDKMGEAVSECWTLQEQNNFNSLFKRKTTMSKGTFWRRAFKRLPFKSRESIVSFYFNVFVLKNVRMQSRLHSSDIDSDDNDEADKVLHESKSSKVAWLR